MRALSEPNTVQQNMHSTSQHVQQLQHDQTSDWYIHLGMWDFCFCNAASLPLIHGTYFNSWKVLEAIGGRERAQGVKPLCSKGKSRTD